MSDRNRVSAGKLPDDLNREDQPHAHPPRPRTEHTPARSTRNLSLAVAVLTAILTVALAKAEWAVAAQMSFGAMLAATLIHLVVFGSASKP